MYRIRFGRNVQNLPIVGNRFLLRCAVTRKGWKKLGLATRYVQLRSGKVDG